MHSKRRGLAKWFATATIAASIGPARADVVTVAIDYGTTYQTIEGFGVHHSSWADDLGDYIGTNLRPQVLDAVFTQVGITMGNLDIDRTMRDHLAEYEYPPGIGERSGNDDTDPFNFNWDGYTWWNGNPMKTLLVDLAEPMGFDNYYLGNKINVRWTMPWLAQIRHDDYERYLDECAEHIVMGQLRWLNDGGNLPRYTQLFNEALSGNVELWSGSYQEVIDIIRRTGGRLRAEGFDTMMFVVPSEETEQGSLDLATAILADPDARQYVGAIGYHPYPYGSTYSGIPNILATSGTGNPDPAMVTVRNQLRDLGHQYGIPVWMTEVSNGGVDPLSMDALRGRAIHIHDELIYAAAAAYFGMNALFTPELIGPGAEGNVVTFYPTTETYEITGMGYAIGHYARWINRGAVRIEATSSDPLVQVTAFRDDGTGHLVIVAINNASAERTLETSLGGLALAGDLRGEQSTASAYWQPLAPFTPTDTTSFMVTLPPESVTTIGGALDPPPIPTVSQWGMIGMALLLVTAGTLVFRARRRATG